MAERIYLSPPHMSGLEQDYIKEAFTTNWIAPLGPNVEAFEQELARCVGAKWALALSSGTAAIHLTLKSLAVGSGDIVFCSTFTFAASANPIVYQGATPVFIDSEPETWNMSPQALARAFADHEKAGKLPKAVMIVNLYGQSADMDPLLEMCARYDVPVIEDAAESLGATYKGKNSGTFGRFGVFSFNGNKVITTSGGGAVVSDDLAALNKMRFWATQARDPARYYQHSEIGYNYRLSNVLAGIGRGQLRVLADRVATRRAIYERYRSALGQIDAIGFMPEFPQGRSICWLTAMTIDAERSRVTVNDVIDALEKENIESRPVWKPLHLQPVFGAAAYYPHSPQDSVSDRLFAGGVCLPSGSSLTPADQDRVIRVIKSLFRDN